MGIALDAQRNRDARGFDEVCLISADDSKVAVLVVPTDEESMMAREALRAISRSYITQVLEAQKQQSFLVEVSAHHAHLTQEHVEALFGAGHQLAKHSDLSQPGQYACKEQVALVGPKGRIERVRVLGPARKYSQVEIAMTEQFKLGIHPPIRESGDIEGSYFTHHMLSALRGAGDRDGNGVVTLAEAYQYAYAHTLGSVAASV